MEVGHGFVLPHLLQEVPHELLQSLPGLVLEPFYVVAEALDDPGHDVHLLLLELLCLGRGALVPFHETLQQTYVVIHLEFAASGAD